MAQVSVVIPVYNRAVEVRTAIASVLAQSHRDWELIVVDDGSIDDLQSSVESFADPRIRLVRHERNQCAAAARNTGVNAAGGEWVAFLDSDDSWDSDKLERQLASLATEPAARAGTTGYRIRHPVERQTREFSPRPTDARPQALLWGCRLSPGATLMVDRRCFHAIGPFDVRLKRFEDWDWLIRYASQRPLSVEPSVLVSVNRGGHPSYAAVTEAVEVMRQKHLANYYATSWIAGRKFESSLLIETAAAALYAGRNREARRLVMQAILRYPLRNGAFFATGLRRLIGTAARGGNLPGER
jgi:glycosyltransferase involved in cell wall biosynthesis